MAKEYIVPVTWKMKGYVKVNAESAEEAMVLISNADDLIVPNDAYSIEESYGVETDDQEEIELYTHAYESGDLGAKPIDYMAETKNE